MESHGVIQSYTKSYRCKQSHTDAYRVQSHKALFKIIPCPNYSDSYSHQSYRTKVISGLTDSYSVIHSQRVSYRVIQSQSYIIIIIQSYAGLNRVTLRQKELGEKYRVKQINTESYIFIQSDTKSKRVLSEFVILSLFSCVSNSMN